MASDELGKFIIDVRTNDIYFIDVNVFNIHADFVLGELLKLPWTAENVREYNLNYERVKPRFILGYLTHHLKIDRWSFAFWEGDKIDAPDVVRAKKRLGETFFVKNLAFRPDSPMQQKVATEVKRMGHATVTNDEIYKAADFQAFHIGRAVGKLRVVPVGTPFESLAVRARRDRPAPGELPGHHAGRRHHRDHVLDAAVAREPARERVGHPERRRQEGARQVRGARRQGRLLRGHRDGGTLREATPRRDQGARGPGRRGQARGPAAGQARGAAAGDADTDAREGRHDLRHQGGEPRRDRDGERARRRTCPSGFGVPLFFYAQHMKQHGLDAKASRRSLREPRFKTDVAWRKARARGACARRIADAPIDPRRRSTRSTSACASGSAAAACSCAASTNAEDLPGFNGAGLYDTVPNVRGKQRARARRSRPCGPRCETLRAVDERDAFGIDHRQVYAGVLVQVGRRRDGGRRAGDQRTSTTRPTRTASPSTPSGAWACAVVEARRCPSRSSSTPTNDGTKIISRADDSDDAGLRPSRAASRRSRRRRAP